ncbi:hypothetical protein [Pseudomonas sp. Pseusp97]|uniref:hypothetical protein n=1 Tax=Pseudomonas sp. Pseusp97 TaxID=3243065 RepID=UPI0039A60F1E
MKTSLQIQEAIGTLSAAFAPLNCVIQAKRKHGFSFTLVNEHGIAKHTERLYPQQYLGEAPLNAVIQRVQATIAA